MNNEAVEHLKRVEGVAKSHSWLISYAILAAATIIRDAINNAGKGRHEAH